METEEIGSGPVKNKEGKAFVQSLQHGLQSTYAIMGKQVRRKEGATILLRHWIKTK